MQCEVRSTPGFARLQAERGHLPAAQGGVEFSHRHTVGLSSSQPEHMPAPAAIGDFQLAVAVGKLGADVAKRFRVGRPIEIELAEPAGKSLVIRDAQ